MLILKNLPKKNKNVIASPDNFGTKQSKKMRFLATLGMTEQGNH